MKNTKISKAQAESYNDWQQATGKKPKYGAIDINQLDFTIENLNDSDIYEETKANKVAFDLLMLFSEYLNGANITEIENIIDVNEYSRMAVAIFRKFKPVIDNGLLNWATAEQRGEGLTKIRQEQAQAAQGTQPPTYEEIEKYCIDNRLNIDSEEIYKTFERANRTGGGRVVDWRKYVLGIHGKNQNTEHAKKIQQFQARVLSEHEQTTTNKD